MAQICTKKVQTRNVNKSQSFCYNSYIYVRFDFKMNKNKWKVDWNRLIYGTKSNPCQKWRFWIYLVNKMNVNKSFGFSYLFASKASL